LWSFWYIFPVFGYVCKENAATLVEKHICRATVSISHDTFAAVFSKNKSQDFQKASHNKRNIVPNGNSLIYQRTIQNFQKNIRMCKSAFVTISLP
jgi:hypothetical protein